MSLPFPAATLRASVAPLLVVLVVCSGCASSARVSDPYEAPAWTPADEAPVVREATPPPSSARTAAVEQQLRAEFQRWEGTPHVWGGTTPRGADCSGFVKTVYDDLFALDLPRTTADQVRVGRTVDPEALQAGDLVFFRPAAKTRHVGIYLSDRTFAHVSSSEGMTISSLDDRYWRNAYWTARRILEPPSGTSPVADARRPRLLEPVREADEEPGDAEETSTPRRRVGW